MFEDVADPERIEDEDGWYTIPGTQARIRAMTPERWAKRQEEIRTGVVQVLPFESGDMMPTTVANGLGCSFFAPDPLFPGLAGDGAT